MLENSADDQNLGAPDQPDFKEDLQTPLPAIVEPLAADADLSDVLERARRRVNSTSERTLVSFRRSFEEFGKSPGNEIGPRTLRSSAAIHTFFTNQLCRSAFQIA